VAIDHIPFHELSHRDKADRFFAFLVENHSLSRLMQTHVKEFAKWCDGEEQQSKAKQNEQAPSR
jgi:hypothetical protein